MSRRQAKERVGGVLPVRAHLRPSPRPPYSADGEAAVFVRVEDRLDPSAPAYELINWMHGAEAAGLRVAGEA